MSFRPFMPVLLLAVVAMLGQQTIATVAKTAIPVLFKAIADDLGFDAELVLAFTWLFACVGIVVMLGCGAFLIRFGALRMSQWGCVLMATGLGLAAMAAGGFWFVIVALGAGAALLSVGVTVATPASSQILARYSPPRWAPLVFSVKQTGVPAGVVLASFLAPALAIAFGWRIAVLSLALACIVIALCLQPCRKEFDADRRPEHPLAFGAIAETFLSVLREPDLRLLAGAAFAFVGLQAMYTNFTVVYLAEELDFELAEAGAALGLATMIAIPGRILWGWIGSAWVSPQLLLCFLAAAMAAGTVTMGFFEPSWSYTAVLIPLLVVSLTALSWLGLLLAEVARFTSGEETGRFTGGVLAFGTAGQIVLPLFFYIGYVIAEYEGAYVAVALPAVVAGIALLRGYLALGRPKNIS